MDTITFTLLVSFLILSIYFVLNNKLKTSKPLNLPPGPPKLPIIGNIHQLIGALPHRAFRDLAQKHGPIMHVQLGQISAVIVSSPRAVRDLFKNHDTAVADRPNALVSNILLYGSTDLAMSPYGNYWRQVKKICSLQLLSAKKVRSFSRIREEEFSRFMESIKLSSGEPINIIQKVTGMVNNVVCIASFGNNCKQQRELIKCMDEIIAAMSGFHLADMFPVLEFVSVRKSKLINVRKAVDKILDDIIEEHRGRKKEGNAEKEESLLEVLLRVKEEGELELPITDDNLKAILVDMFAAGTDTSSTTMEWAMAEIMRNPSVMIKAQTEVREAFNGKTTITDTELEGLSYLQCIIKETLRLHAPLPLLLPHQSNKPCKIDGYDIPNKKKVIINAWACATDPEYWEDPETFKPERFEKTSVDFMGSDYEYIPFGTGRRMCPGLTFGLKTMKFFLSHMLYYYDWRLPHGLNPADIDMTEVNGTVAAKKVHLHLIPTVYCRNI